MIDDALGDGSAELRHALREPCGDAATMQRQISNSGAFHTNILDVFANDIWAATRAQRKPGFFCRIAYIYCASGSGSRSLPEGDQCQEK